jgi:hypothetical protein
VTAALEVRLKNPQEMMAVIGDRNLTAPHLNQTLNAARQLADTIRTSTSMQRRSLVTAVVSRITIASSTLVLSIRRGRLLHAIGFADGPVSSIDAAGDEQAITVPFSLRRRGVEAKLIVGDGPHDTSVDPVLVSTLAKAHAWFAELVSMRSASMTLSVSNVFPPDRSADSSLSHSSRPTSSKSSWRADNRPS